MELRKYGPDHLEEYLPSLDFGVGKFIGVTVEYDPHVPVIDTAIIKDSIVAIGSTEFDFAPGETVISEEVFNAKGCAFIGDDAGRCDRAWGEHILIFTLLIELYRDCTYSEIVQSWSDCGVMQFVQDFESVEFYGDFAATKEKGGDEK